MDEKILKYAENKNLIITEEALRLLNIYNYKKVIDSLSTEDLFITPEHIKKILNACKIEEKKEYYKNFNILEKYDVTNKNLSQGSVPDFLKLFVDKYETLSGIIKKRVDFKPITIAQAKTEIKNKEVDIIAMVCEKRITKNGNMLIVVDDPTGKINLIMTCKTPDELIQAKQLLNDNVIGFRCGVLSKDMLIVKEYYFPDIPYEQKNTNLDDDCYVAIIADTHVGSKLFLEDDFIDFIDWLNNKNCEDTELVSKIKYLIVAGDLVDGIGIYPKQFSELAITDIFEQYQLFEEHILKIPQDIEIFISPGNHDAVRLSDPQPAVSDKFLPRLYTKENIHMLGSPTWIDLEGLLFLVYHGNSLHGIFGEIQGVKTDRPDHALRELLKRRDLMPQYGERQMFMPIEKNFLTINEVPDVFICGHIHHHSFSKYKHTHLIAASCWQSITSYQIDNGHIPTLSKVILFNLKTQEIIVKDFYKDRK